MDRSGSLLVFCSFHWLPGLKKNFKTFCRILNFFNFLQKFRNWRLKVGNFLLVAGKIRKMLDINENVLEVIGEFGAGVHVFCLIVFIVHKLFVGFRVGTPREICFNEKFG